VNLERVLHAGVGSDVKVAIVVRVELLRGGRVDLAAARENEVGADELHDDIGGALRLLELSSSLVVVVGHGDTARCGWVVKGFALRFWRFEWALWIKKRVLAIRLRSRRSLRPAARG
jgi:hypothetical protein